jgi:hypothetical protein
MGGDVCVPERASRDAKFDRLVIACLVAGLVILLALLLLVQFGPDWLISWAAL